MASGHEALRNRPHVVILGAGASVVTIPLGRGESPEEVALAGINLIRSSFITGEVLDINGGAFMRP